MKFNVVWKTIAYLLTTTIIGLVTQLDSKNFDFEHITGNVWLGMILKSMLPALVAIKALFDVPAHGSEALPAAEEHTPESSNSKQP